MNELYIGVVGYSGQAFDNEKAKGLLQQAYDIIDQTYTGQKIVVSGLTDQGIPALAYRHAVERDWKTVGIACADACNYDCFPVDEQIIVGENWGDESERFLSSIDVLVRVGGGQQSIRETAEFMKTGKPVYEYNLEAK